MILEYFPSGMSSVPMAGGNYITNVSGYDFTATVGAVTALTGTTYTTTITGLKTTDQVLVNCITGTLPAGTNIANSRVSAADTLEIRFTTAVAIGVTLGSLTFRVTVFR